MNVDPIGPVPAHTLKRALEVMSLLDVETGYSFEFQWWRWTPQSVAEKAFVFVWETDLTEVEITGAPKYPPGHPLALPGAGLIWQAAYKVGGRRAQVYRGEKKEFAEAVEAALEAISRLRQTVERIREDIGSRSDC